VIVDIGFAVTCKPVPLVAAYRASNAAVNAYTESPAAELASFGVRVHLVLPGAMARMRAATGPAPRTSWPARQNRPEPDGVTRHDH
jgi:NAD(P)-dependent dehydrogenase (short-subunit alcohol dehydrogenase family)